ncbi:GntR family transcriptional regulator [Actinosynnema sp. ALI-1.44]|uniref:GntR family transcriptional regulator n=1 Tax=Actinosynnema sp. ALI-1.44 TaxID=1933779 RepID=UPI0011779CEF|nr:GntR family transcriptional regulator [Actinosynnema sp. ALI-1.44]
MPSEAQPEPLYRRIAGEFEARIRSGDLQPGQRLPSIRQIADRWRIATATRVLASLREAGLVEYSLARHLDGFAILVDERPHKE